ncbi:28S ribosomal protein S7, mitochondrial [Chelonus insularis]|uniref:28S ribosomal protein S7, mitochondrial n=1 Tax=Chelonus insularis TaxID=460826 RepID=UPI00158E3902|nr:28S ribosomal protein S7, mitochondrial [Chelonus insularis]
MINIRHKLSHLQSHVKLLNSFNFKDIQTTRLYSVYPPTYKLPVFRKEDQATLELSGELKKLAHEPIRPVLTYQTCSEFYDPTVSKFINYIMRKGNKELARTLVEGAFEEIKRRQLKKYHNASPEERSQIELDPVKILHKAIENTMPVMMTMPIKKGGTTYQVPSPLLEPKSRFMAMNWLWKTAKEKDKHLRFIVVLAKELLDAADNTGRVVKIKQNLHKQCELNRAYAHFRWS